MTHAKILEKAIKKANKNGWEDLQPYMAEEFGSTGLLADMIFSHRFAKAFWGETPEHYVRYSDSRNGKEALSYPLRNWQYHLQTMVLEPDPLLYLEKFL